MKWLISLIIAISLPCGAQSNYTGGLRSGGIRNAVSANPDPLWINTYTSPDTLSHQGLCTDGTYTYTVDTAAIYKYDASWSVVASNTSPFSGLSQSYNHLGDPECLGGSIYVPAVTWPPDVCPRGTLGILVYSTSTLANTEEHVLSSSDIEDLNSLTINAGTIYVSDSCVANKIRKFSLSTYAKLGDITTSISFSHPQGIVWHGTNLYVSDDADFIGAQFYEVDPSTGTTTDLFGSGFPVANEGIDWNQPELRWLIDPGGLSHGTIHYFVYR